jgi:hypothetical protein
MEKGKGPVAARGSYRRPDGSDADAWTGDHLKLALWFSQGFAMNCMFILYCICEFDIMRAASYLICNTCDCELLPRGQGPA